MNTDGSLVLPELCNLSEATSDFSSWMFSQNRHFDYFKQHGYDIELFGREVDPQDSNLKVYQDLLTFAFIKENFSRPIRMLDIGGGESRILNFFKDDNECWNIDKLEGVGNGPKEIDTNDIRLVRSYMGDFSSELPDNYFDFVFSISVFEHVPQDNPELYQNIIDDIGRVSKPRAIALHSLDCVKHKNVIWANPILNAFYQDGNPASEYLALEQVVAHPDLYLMSEAFYNKSWKFTTGKTFQEFGAPFSYNFVAVQQ